MYNVTVVLHFVLVCAGFICPQAVGDNKTIHSKVVRTHETNRIKRLTDTPPPTTAYYDKDLSSVHTMPYWRDVHTLLIVKAIKGNEKLLAGIERLGSNHIKGPLLAIKLAT